MTAAQAYITVSRRPLDLEDYINVARRHAGWIVGPVFGGLVISIVVAFCWPNTYEAKAVMEITPSRVSAALVQSTMSQQLTERIEQMKSNIESRQSLATLINDPHLNLYKEDRAKEPLDDVEDEMREAIKIQINPEMMAANRTGASIFTISFSYSSKKAAVDTVNALISRFEAESINTQKDQQDTAQSFVGDEVATAKADLDRETEILNRFRKDNEGRLPEEEQMNIESLRSLETQAGGVAGNLQRLASERVTIETNIQVAENQLKLSQSMAEELADAVPLPNSATARQNEELVAMNKTIDADELQLQQLKERFQPTYPEIRVLESNLKVLRKKRDDISAKQDSDQAAAKAAEDSKAKTPAKKPTNFRAVENESNIEGQIQQQRARLKNNDTERDALLKQQENLNKEIAAYRDRLTATTLLEAPYQDLKRDYQTAADKYEKYQKQKEMTTQSAELISRRATEYLDTLDPPTTPQKPSSPKRPLIIGAGFAISLMLGFALAGLQEARDASLKNLKDVRAYTNLPVLCSIPLLENTLLVKRKRRITYLAWSSTVIVGILAVCGSLFYYYTVIVNT
jgi:uncharacterized protein involved in exopolysaccharide biosynthesis